MAEALLRSMGRERFEAYSAGTTPSRVHPLAVKAMQEIGIDLSAHRSKDLDEYRGMLFDYVITVCDQAREACPFFPGARRQLHWSLPDPSAAAGDEATQLPVFRSVRDELTGHVREFVAARDGELNRSPAMRHAARTEFHSKLQSLQDEVLLLGSLVDRALDRSMEALKQRDLVEARQVIGDDDAIDAKRIEIEERALALIATEQPVASDLRAIAAVLSIGSDLERMGDHAEGIGKIVLLHGDQPHVKPLIDLPRMAEMGRDMLKRSLEAFVHRDESLARQVCADDDRVDELWEQVWHELLLIMLQNPTTIQRATYLIWAGHNLERFADRATNIAERVVFLITGKLEELNLSRY